MKPRRDLDASRLPEAAYGHRAPIWWANVLLATIEGMMFALSLMSYFYLRGRSNVWPTASGGRDALVYATLGATSLLLSAVPMRLATRAAVRGKLRPMRAWMIVATTLAGAFLACRALELHALPFRWDQHAYGSIFWTTLGLHTAHGITSVLENAVLLVLLFRGPVEKEHLVDIHANGVYWNFVVISGALIAAILYIERVGLAP